ncbi:hypothetical protein C1H46_040920 [Malus baccata]|uniref:Uncharacterized protein n=1 Tax=Malus baccata TaxID=106549 RepID=A0A540KH36_MALBA|nr:hypothetical protein C1H46_040920 [Malus baccata]
MTSYSHGPGYFTKPAYSTRQGYSTGLGHSTEPTYSTRSNGTFEPARTYGSYPNQSGYNRHPGYGDYSDQYSTNKPYKHSNTARYDNYDDNPHNRKHNGGAMGTTINMIANGSGHNAKPNRGSLLAAARPVRRDGRLIMPMDDMERALHYLAESSKPNDKYYKLQTVSSRPCTRWCQRYR